MTELAWRAPALAPWLLSAAAGTGRSALATFRLGGRALVAAPVLVAIAVVPELMQHVAEISLGMFESREAFLAYAHDPLRWAFAYPKLIGFLAAMLAVARFWALGSVRAALLIRPSILLRVVLAIGFSIFAEYPFSLLRAAMGPGAPDLLLTAVSLVLQGGVLVFLVAALLEDRVVGLRAAFTSHWPTALLLAPLIALAFAPAQLLHSAHHDWAIGQPEVLVWALMLWDSLWVGLMAALIGSALFVAHRAGPTWRGWSTDPRAIG